MIMRGSPPKHSPQTQIQPTSNSYQLYVAGSVQDEQNIAGSVEDEQNIAGSV